MGLATRQRPAAAAIEVVDGCRRALAHCRTVVPNCSTMALGGMEPNSRRLNLGLRTGRRLGFLLPVSVPCSCKARYLFLVAICGESRDTLVK